MDGKCLRPIDGLDKRNVIVIRGCAQQLYGLRSRNVSCVVVGGIKMMFCWISTCVSSVRKTDSSNYIVIRENIYIYRMIKYRT